MDIPPPPPPGMMDPPQPVYTRLSLKHVELDTLNTFRMPWVIDRHDPGYVLVRQWVPEELQDMLWEHTRRLRQRDTGKSEPEPALFVNLDDQFHPGPHGSFCVLAPIITVECRHNELLIAARFNIETTILQYSSNQRDGHELFLHDVCLKYLHNSAKDVLYTAPESDPAMAFSITKTTASQMSPQAGLSASQTPSANVSLALTHSTQLNVQYAVSSWSVSGHRVVDGHQWYWAGTQEETKLLTPDLTQTVKRHVVVKRTVPMDAFPFKDGEEKTTEEKAIAPAVGQAQGTTESDNIGLPASANEDYLNRLREALKRQFTFRFHTQVRVKRRMGRLHRMLVLSFNNVKAKFLDPAHEVDFSLSPSEKWINDLIAQGYPADGLRVKGSGGHRVGEDGREGKDENGDENVFPVDFMALETVHEESTAEDGRDSAIQYGHPSTITKGGNPTRKDTEQAPGDGVEEIRVGDANGHSSSSPTRDRILSGGDRLGDSTVKDESLVEERNQESGADADGTEKAGDGFGKKEEVENITTSTKGKAKVNTRVTVLEPSEEDSEDAEEDKAGKDARSKGFKFPLGNTIDIEFTLDKIIEKCDWDLETLHGKRLADVWEHQAVQSLYDMIRWRKDMGRTRTERRETIAREVRSEGSTGASRPTHRTNMDGPELDLRRDTRRWREPAPPSGFQTHRQRSMSRY